MRAVDTNLVVRLLTRDDPRQTTAAEKFLKNGAWLSHLVLVETVWVLTSVYALRQPEIVAAIETLLDHQSLAIEDPVTIAAALANYGEKNVPDFSDCLILETAARTAACRLTRSTGG